MNDYFDLDSFLKSGCIVTANSESLWIGWGEASRSGQPDFEALSIYAPDFFFKDPQPWWIFSRNLKKSGGASFQRTGFQKMSKAALLALLQKNSHHKVQIQWDPIQDSGFQVAFADLQVQFQKGNLVKAVPVVFQKGSLPNPNQPQHDLSWKCHWLNQLLQNTQGLPLHLYGVWNSYEGILGATPELLFEVSSNRVLSTAALAGTRLKNQLSQFKLLEDPKERREHQLVIEGISTSFQALGLDSIQIGETVELELPTLSHLYTPISVPVPGFDQDHQSFEKLVTQLHPTPALGAVPREQGWKWLFAQNRNQDRNRFGAPFGARVGNAFIQCSVAIRNLQWKKVNQQVEISLGAGCGVLPESQLDREWKEILGKMRSVKKLFGMESDVSVLSAEHLNTALTRKVLVGLLELGVEEICLCPGARNAPFVAAFSSNPHLFKTHTFFEERSAAFFALGRIKSSGKPVALVTTSGTAAGELLPATMEAHYSGLPLVVVTADRPRNYRGSGAPQTAEQVGLFGVYVSHSKDWDQPHEVDFSEFFQTQVTQRNQPIHLNISFDEPLLESTHEEKLNEIFRIEDKPTVLRGAQTELEFEVEAQKKEIQSFLNRVKNPVAIVSMLSPSVRDSVAKLLLKWNIPSYFEGISGLREMADLDSIRIRCVDGLFQKAQECDYPINGLIRIGGVPTVRLWRDLETSLVNLPVLSLSELPFSGLGRPSYFVNGSLTQLCSLFSKTMETPFEGNTQRLMEKNSKWTESLSILLASSLNSEGNSEPGVLAALSRRIPKGSRIYLGNSLPIREWDLAASFEDRGFEVWGSRGLNGIDGQISTFFGYAQPGVSNWAILGDLTALYDLSGPWILSQLRELSINIVIINNGGGKIFSRIFPLSQFQNQHQIGFRSWAEMWKLDYQCVSRVDQISDSEASPHRVIEVIPDEYSTSQFWKEYSKL